MMCVMCIMGSILAPCGGASGTHLGAYGATCLKFPMKLSRRWAQDGRSWGQVGLNIIGFTIEYLILIGFAGKTFFLHSLKTEYIFIYIYIYMCIYIYIYIFSFFLKT
jgi:hypothetical protein